jgi:hypothetical protein
VKRESALVRAWVGVGLACLLSLWLTFRFADEFTAYSRQTPDPWAMARQQARYALLRAELPAPSVVGYYSDVPPGAGKGNLAFFATVYSMAPHLVVEESGGRRMELVVGNFSRRPDLGRLERERGLKLVKDYGGGVMLFRREKK